MIGWRRARSLARQLHELRVIVIEGPSQQICHAWTDTITIDRKLDE